MVVAGILLLRGSDKNGALLAKDGSGVVITMLSETIFEC